MLLVKAMNEHSSNKSGNNDRQTSYKRIAQKKHKIHLQLIENQTICTPPHRKGNENLVIIKAT